MRRRWRWLPTRPHMPRSRKWNRQLFVCMATSGLVYGTAFLLLIIYVRISPTLISSVSLTFVLINPRPLMKLRLRAPSIENGIKTELMASTRAPIDIHSCPLTQRCPKQDTVTPTQPTHRQYSLLYRPNKNSPIQDYSFIITKLLYLEIIIINCELR